MAVADGKNGGGRQPPRPHPNIALVFKPKLYIVNMLSCVLWQINNNNNNNNNNKNSAHSGALRVYMGAAASCSPAFGVHSLPKVKNVCAVGNN